MRVAVRRLHAAGIEVILDVVYNHTAEGSELGPTLSFRGLDNASYYRLVPDNPRHCINDTGTGNTLNLSHPRVLQMVMDSLRYWVDLVSRRRLPLRSRRDAWAAKHYGFDPGCGLLRRVAPGPGAVAREADRRAVGHRPRRLSARPVIRPASPNGTTGFATACAASGAAMPASARNSPRGSPGSADLFRPPRPPRPGPRSITPPRMTASRLPISSATRQA